MCKVRLIENCAQYSRPRTQMEQTYTKTTYYQSKLFNDYPIFEKA